MFPPEVYQARRKKLQNRVSNGIAIIFGNPNVSRNFLKNSYPFRQDSNFLYFFGIDLPGYIGIIDFDQGTEILVGSELTMDDIIWDGFQPTLAEQGAKAGVNNVLEIGALSSFLCKKEQATIRILPPYSPYRENLLHTLFPGRPIKILVSEKLIKAVVALRSVKESIEIAEMESTINNITRPMYEKALELAKDGVSEQTIAGEMEGIALKYGKGVAYQSIVTKHGEILHNNNYGNILHDGDLLLIDAGAEANSHYATDITRTFPIGGKFTPQQEAIYSVVLEAEKAAIQLVKPGISFREVHTRTALSMANGLKSLGIMKGDINEAVLQGAHALFFPHGLGHQIGLDVHDMEDLGENYVGYTDTIKRSEQFGTAFLRLGRKLEENFVVTIEPGLYFIPALIDKWKAEKLHTNFINYDALDAYRDFGGIRIEDDVLITSDGSRILGKPIPKEVNEITY